MGNIIGSVKYKTKKIMFGSMRLGIPKMAYDFELYACIYLLFSIFQGTKNVNNIFVNLRDIRVQPQLEHF